jgi:oligopeptide/dipeptide ABC transporter ATP-binding protein
VRGLSKRFALPQGVLHAVDAVSFAIAPGEVLGLVGESGCGKSTLVRLIARLLDPSDGSIMFDGVDVAGVPAAAFGRHPARRAVQMVFQDPTDSLNPRFTAFDAVADPARRLLPSASRADRDRRVARAFDLVGLPRAFMTRYPHQLSGGQKARVGIARALVVEPRLLLLDEPTSALDVSIQAVVLRLLMDLKRELGLTLLFISHDLNVVRLICDNVLVMYLGRVVESGPAARLFTAPAHPYTQALVSAVPSVDPAMRARRIRLEGEPTSPIDPSPTTCRFAGRCNAVGADCRTRMPQLTPIAENHHAACWRLS